MKKLNQFTFLILFEFVFCIILYKVIYVPITHDETATIVHYFNFNVWQIMMYPDHWPNNHILNTLITKLFIVLFGKEQWIVRLPNLLSFILYSIAVYRINKSIFNEDSIFFIAASTLFIANAYMLDFFGLCRGYAMSCAIATMSVSYLISGYKEPVQKHIWIALLLAILASYANFTLLVFWIAVTIMVWLFFLTRSVNKVKQLIKPTIIIAAITIGYLALIMNPIIKMNSTNEFQYWTSRGFYSDTLISVIDYWRSGAKIPFNPNSHVLAGFVFCFLALNLFYIIITFIRKESRITILRNPVFAVTLVLLLTALVSILQSFLLKTPNLFGRTALFFYPLIIAVFVSSLGLISSPRLKVVKGIFSICILLFCLIHLKNTINLRNIKEWPYDASTLEVLDYLNKKNTDTTTILKTSWFFHPSFHFYAATGKTPWLELKPYDKRIDPNTNAEYYYIFSNEFDTLRPIFEIDYKLSDDRWLLKRKAALPDIGH